MLKLPGNKTWYQFWYQTYTVLLKVSCQDIDKTSILILRTNSILARSCQDHNSDLTFDRSKCSTVGNRTHDLVIPTRWRGRLNLITKTLYIAHISYITTLSIPAYTNMTAGYKGFSGKRQWEISQLVLKLQELTTSDKSQSDLMHNNIGLSLMSPTNHGLKCQSQNRLQPRCKILFSPK